MKKIFEYIMSLPQSDEYDIIFDYNRRTDEAFVVVNRRCRCPTCGKTNDESFFMSASKGLDEIQRWIESKIK